jgi:hypothetical protein
MGVAFVGRMDNAGSDPHTFSFAVTLAALMDDAIAAFKRAVASVPNRRPYPDVNRKTQLKMLKQVEDLASCVLGVPAARLRKITGGGWALHFVQSFAWKF